MVFPTNIKNFSSLFRRLGHRRMAQLILALLLIYIAYISAQMTWLVLPQAQSSVNANTNNASTKNFTTNKENSTIDVAKIQALNLFGQFNNNINTSAKIEMVNVPQTRLNVTLSGLVASDEKSIAAAVIENQGKQETYGIGDIIVGTRANLEQVLMDRVIIKHSGRLETLMLDGFDYNQPALGIASTNGPINSLPTAGEKSPRAGVVDQRSDKQLTAVAQNLRNELSQNPAKIGDYLRISPKRKAGNIVGYTLRPGKKAEFFKQAGLKTGDIAIEMNGYNLIVPTQAMQAMAAMKTAQHISLLVNRQGSLTQILISLQ